MADLQKVADRKKCRHAKTAKEIKALMPKGQGHSHSKRHVNESLQDFRDRRKVSNRRRRKREKGIQV